MANPPAWFAVILALTFAAIAIPLLWMVVRWLHEEHLRLASERKVIVKRHAELELLERCEQLEEPEEQDKKS